MAPAPCLIPRLQDHGQNHHEAMLEPTAPEANERSVRRAAPEGGDDAGDIVRRPRRRRARYHAVGGADAAHVFESRRAALRQGLYDGVAQRRRPGGHAADCLPPGAGGRLPRLRSKRYRVCFMMTTVELWLGTVDTLPTASRQAPAAAGRACGAAAISGLFRGRMKQTAI